jgi:hypothetical protein
MKKRHRNEPDPQNPDPSLTYEYLVLAGANIGGSDYLANAKRPKYQRDFARAALLNLYRLQKEQSDREGHNLIDPEIVQFVQRELALCASDPDPLTCIERFLGLRRDRGRPRTPWRDVQIAGEVAKRRKRGETLEQAYNVVAQARPLTPEQVKRIYYACKKADPSEIAMRACESG